MERGLYADAGVAAGDVWHRVIVVERRNETADSVSLTLTSIDGSALPRFVPGQYVSVGVHLSDGARQIRQYSLCSAPSAGDWEITVKRLSAHSAPDGSPVPGGEVSNFLYDNVFERDVLDVTTPFGDVVLPDDDSPLVLISAGIGCTPVIGILSYLAEIGDERPIAVLHADRSPSAHAHRAQLSELVDALPSAVMHRWYEDLGARQPSAEIRSGRVDLNGIDIAAEAQVYLCGPLPFMHGVRTALLEKGVAEARIHYELFGPDSGSPAAA
jgi:nitric oxide dioxygenase